MLSVRDSIPLILSSLAIAKANMLLPGAGAPTIKSQNQATAGHSRSLRFPKKPHMLS